MKIKYILSVLFIFMAARFSFSQQWLTHQYTGLNGLPSANVYDITQDNMGRIWMTTRGGITCYDGLLWKNYNVADGLPVLSFEYVRIDPENRVWALSKEGQGELYVTYFDGNRWITLNPPDNSTLRDSAFSSFDVITTRGADNPVIIVGTRGSGVLRWENGKWTSINTGNGLSSNQVNGIARLNQRLYVATDNGLSVINPDQTVDHRPDQILDLPSLPSPEIKGIVVESKDKFPDYPLKNSRIWLYGHRWLLGFEENEGEKPHTRVYNPLNTVFTVEAKYVRLQPDYRGGLYIGNHEELYYFNYENGKTQIITLQNNMVGRGTNGMFIDFEKTIWVACDRGVTKIAGRAFTSYQMKNGLLEDEVSAILEYEPGKFVLGHNNGFTFYDQTTGKFQKLPVIGKSKEGFSLCRVLDMHIDSKKCIWAAMGRSGVAKINPKRELQWFGEQHGLIDNVVSLWVGPGDKIWAASEAGIYQREGARFVPAPWGPLSRTSIRRFFGENKQLRFMAGQGTGVYVLNNKTNQWENYSVEGNSKINAVYAIYKDKKDRLLIGTLAGLYTLRGKKIMKFKEKDFEVHRPVYFLVEDLEKRLWVGTDHGVIRWDGNKVIYYSVPNGLIGLETNRAAGIIDNTGKLWIGTNRGLSIYDETFDNHDRSISLPKVFLVKLEIGNQTIPPDRLTSNQPLTFDYKNNTVAIHFRGISFLDESKILFSHKLDGFDENWLDEHYPYNQVIRYTNLSPGTYRFHIKVRNVMGVWSEVVSSPGITITKPFYREWWFFLVLLLPLGLIFYSFFHFLSARRSAALLEQLVEERTGQLRASEKQYRTLFDESRDTIFTASEKGRVLDINPAGVELAGYASREELLNSGIDPNLFFSQKDLLAIYKEIKRKGYIKDFEMQITRKDGETRTTLVTATPVLGDSGEFRGVHGIARDITEKKRLRQQLEQAQKMEAIGTLAGGIAHDFNNILSVITGYIELSLDDLPEDTIVRANLDQVLIAAGRAKELVNQILTFSRQSHKERKPLRIALLLKEVLKLLRSSLPTTIEIRRDIRAESAVVLADATQIQQVVMNLCTNAAHAMRKKGGLLQVGLHEVVIDETAALAYNDLKPGNYLELAVTDNGHGIAPDILKRIFEPYFTTKKKGEGTGMGLAVIHGIVKSHDGEITVYSEPGKGTVFHVLLPTVKENADIQADSGEFIPAGKSEHILFVDDEKLLVEVGKRLLQRLGYRVTAKSSSREALDAFRASPGDFHMVITDLTMPYLTGIDLTKEIRKLRPDIPIILCTGYSEVVTPKHIERLRIQKLLLKPVTRNNLGEAIREALEK